MCHSNPSRVDRLLCVALGLADTSLSLHLVVTKELARLLLDACNHPQKF